MTTLATSARRGLTTALLGAGFAAATAPAALADVTVDLKVSSGYAFVGFPVTATVTSSTSGTLTLQQARTNATEGPGRCSSEPLLYRRIAGTTRTVTAGTPIKVTVQPAALFYFGGNPFQPAGWNNPNIPSSQDLCWDKPSQFRLLVAEVIGTSDFGETSKPLVRVL